MHENKDMFDLSDITNDRFKKFYDVKNKKVLGKMKPEYANNKIQEFVGLRSKMYSIKFEDGQEHKKAKGIVYSVTQKDLRHDMYKTTLETGGKMLSRMNVIRSNKHQLYTMEMMINAGLKTMVSAAMLMVIIELSVVRTVLLWITHT